MKRMEDAPIFIMGVQRSGTTLLSFILDSHPNIAVGRETLVFRAMHYLFGDDAKTNELLLVQNWFEKFGVSREEFAHRVKRFLDDFFRQYAEKHGKKRWGEKTPWHTYYCDLIREIFPEAQFVHIVRDPRAVCASRMNWPGTIESFAQEWQEQNERLVNFGASLPEEQYMRIRYEDLILEPRRTLEQLISFLHEQWSDSLLSHNKIVSNQYVSVDPKSGTDPRIDKKLNGKFVVEGGFMNNPERPLDNKSLNLWKVKLRKIHIRKIQKITERGMRFFGYKMAYGLTPLIGKVELEA